VGCGRGDSYFGHLIRMKPEKIPERVVQGGFMGADREIDCNKTGSRQ